MDRKIILVGTLGRDAEKNASAHFWTEAKVTDQVVPHAPQRASTSIRFNSAANSLLFSDVKAFATLQASFALCGWQLEPAPRIDGSTTYLVSRWDHMRILKDLDQVRALLAEIGGAT